MALRRGVRICEADRARDGMKRLRTAEKIDRNSCTASMDKPLPCSLPLSKRQLGILCTIVKPLMRLVLDMRHDLWRFCRSIRAQLIGDHALGCNALLLQWTDQQAPGGLSLHDFVKNIPILNRPPQPAFPVIDPHDQLIEMPDIIMRRRLAANAVRDIARSLGIPLENRILNNSLQQDSCFSLKKASPLEEQTGPPIDYFICKQVFRVSVLLSGMLIHYQVLMKQNEEPICRNATLSLEILLQR
jgi:hypothetical protein